jgi:hypothetical protein
MEIHCHDQDYGAFCLRHSKQYGGKTIDKLTFSVPKHYFRKNVFQHRDRIINDAFYIENCNNKLVKLHLQGEYINPLIPMLDSVMKLFYSISLSQVFLEDINCKIRNSLEKCNNLNCGSVEFVRFLNINCFKFSELELAFDFFGCTPFTDINNESFKELKNGLYTPDYKIYKRKVFKEDDSYGFENDRIRDSIFIIYNRGEKLGIQEVVWRIEWRLRDERSRRLLDITDLRLNMDGYICRYGHRLERIFNYWVPRNSIIFNNEYIESHFPIFAVLVTG